MQSQHFPAEPLSLSTAPFGYGLRVLATKLQPTLPFGYDWRILSKKTSLLPTASPSTSFPPMLFVGYRFGQKFRNSFFNTLKRF